MLCGDHCPFWTGHKNVAWAGSKPSKGVTWTPFVSVYVYCVDKSNIKHKDDCQIPALTFYITLGDEPEGVGCVAPMAARKIASKKIAHS
jgi:hypothetical protein